MSKVKLNFLLEKKAIYCGNLENFGEGYARYFDQVEDTKGIGGVYVILSDNQNFIYPNGESKVIYIGQSDSLYDRINTHKKWHNRIKILGNKDIRGDWIKYKYLYMRKFGAKLYYIPASKNEDCRDLESNIMENFYDKYFSLPVGNAAFSYGKN